MSNEADLVRWLEVNRPAVACSLAYCNDLEEVRALLNHHSGIDVQSAASVEDGYRRWLAAFERQACHTQ